MENITFVFDQVKALETIIYLTQRISNSSVYGICKLLYLSDKVSLGRYGRFIFGESYCAMEGGGTPSNAYDLLKSLSCIPHNDLRVVNNKVTALRDANLDYFSKSDLECLDEIIQMYGKASNETRRKAAHDGAWQKAWNKRGNKGSIPIPVTDIAKQFPDSEDLISYLCNSDVG